MKDIIIGGELFPKECPENCPGKKETVHQGSLCHHCPIFNCAGDHFMLIQPSDYRRDWARVWKEWFDSGMKGLPKLYLTEPSWEEDSHGYINRSTTEINIQEQKACYNDENLMLTNPNIARKSGLVT